MAAPTPQLLAYFHWLQERGFAYPRAAPRVVEPLDLEAVKGSVRACIACALANTGIAPQWGFGSEAPKVIFVGDGPLGGTALWSEPEQELLLKIVAALGLGANEAFFTGAVRCRMPDARPPDAAAFDACRGHLAAIIATMQPRALVVMGGLAARSLFGEGKVFGDLRGNVLERHPLGALPLVVTYHPRDLLKQPQMKRVAWADLQLIKPFVS